ncbi:Uncharacterized protein apha_02297 [Umezakia ovalisporum]|uniref:(2Fe-2S) ferredoxin domain-containing protein n=1 Tax=Umezakia ovalisporum TaxID=75695 RepID=UPI0006F006D8|nr:Uncharacterized protein apha_02297 [Umezakia ovalisporum]
MSKSYSTEISEFALEGRFIDFVIKDGYKLKGLLLRTSEGECYVKLAKHLRPAFDLRLPSGTWLQVVGYKKHDIKTDQVTLKAEGIMAARADVGKVATLTPAQEAPATNTTQGKSVKNKQTILVCQKSDCMKRGSKQVCQALEAALSNRGLEDQVTVKGTGCMKKCKAGPNVVMPDKTRYSPVEAGQVPAIIDKYFADTREQKRQENCSEVVVRPGKFW